MHSAALIFLPQKMAGASGSTARTFYNPLVLRDASAEPGEPNMDIRGSSSSLVVRTLTATSPAADQIPLSTALAVPATVGRQALPEPALPGAASPSHLLPKHAGPDSFMPVEW